MKKVTGYILSVLGLFGILLTFEKVKEITKITFLGSVTNFQIIIISLVLIGIGVFLIAKEKKPTTQKEVPIYKGKEIVGYRQH